MTQEAHGTLKCAVFPRAVDFPMAAGQQVHVTRVHHLHPAEVAR